MIAKEGRIILIPLLLITFPIGIYAHASNNNILIILYSILGLLFLFSLNFFRDPVRVVPNDKGTVISPADGKIVKSGSVSLANKLEEKGYAWVRESLKSE